MKKYSPEWWQSLPPEKSGRETEKLVATYTNAGDTVLDNCAGSGTTGVACGNLNRSCFLMEKDAGYFEVLNRRIKRWRRERSLKMN